MVICGVIVLPPLKPEKSACGMPRRSSRGSVSSADCLKLKERFRRLGGLHHLAIDVSPYRFVAVQNPQLGGLPTSAPMTAERTKFDQSSGKKLVEGRTILSRAFVQGRPGNPTRLSNLPS